MRRWISIYPLCLLGLLCAGCNSYFYWPEQRPPIPQITSASGLQIHQFESGDGTRLQGWFLPSRREDTQGLAVYCHGADTNVGDYYHDVSYLPDYGFDVFMFDYRGYGASEGDPERAGTIEDTHAAIDYAKKLPMVRKPDPVALYGFSLGAGIALVVASERIDVAGVVNQSGFTTYREIGREVVGQRWTTWWLQPIVPVFVSKGFDPIDYVDKISPRPLFLLHGDEDELVPLEMAERLYAKAKEPKKLWVMKGVSHWEPRETRHPRLERRIAGYLSYIFATAEGLDPEIPPDCFPGDRSCD
jgi:fermentation-respiration switch protein FrsA (DUF1100 family)